MIDGHADETLLSAAKAGVRRRASLVAEFGEAHVRAQLAARRWQAPTRPVVVCHNGPLTNRDKTWAVLLSAPPGALLHGLSSAVHDGLRGFTPDCIEVVVPASSRNPVPGSARLPRSLDARIRWSSKLGPEDVAMTAVPPRTRLPRSIVDAASGAASRNRARVIVLAAVQQKLVTPAALADALTRRGPCRHRGIIVESIGDAAGGIQSLPEREFERIRVRCGLPRTERQSRVETPRGTCYLDNDWPARGIRAEVHGIPHSRVANWDGDLLRQNEIVIAGGGLLVFSSFAIRHQPDLVAAQLTAMFRRSGWHG